MDQFQKDIEETHGDIYDWISNNEDLIELIETRSVIVLINNNTYLLTLDIEKVNQ